MDKVPIYLIILLVVYSCHCYETEQERITRILNAYKNSDYNKLIRPNYGSYSVNVGVTMHVIGITSIDVMNMEMTMDFYFRQRWIDNRLAFNSTDMFDHIVVSQGLDDQLWTPDTFFANARLVTQSQAANSKGNSFIRISRDGTVYHSRKLSATFSCPMNLQYYPMDRQICALEMESYGFSASDIRYSFPTDKAVGLSAVLELPEYRVVGHKQLEKLEVLSTGNYSRLILEIEFVRSCGYYLGLHYFPAIFMVITSWIPHWLPRKQISTRLAIALVTMLALVCVSIHALSNRPKISYVSHLDVYLWTSFLLGFVSLLQNTIVGYRSPTPTNRLLESDGSEKTDFEYRNRTRQWLSLVTDIDCLFRWLMPALFILFNVWYWLIQTPYITSTLY